MVMKRLFGSISAIAASAMIAASITILPAASGKVVASAPPASTETFRDTLSFGAVCSEQAWPYIAANCLNDPRVGTGKAKAARVVTSDRFHLSATR
jgi:hypothetical protein